MVIRGVLVGAPWRKGCCNGIYKPMRQYDAKTLWKDAGAHLAFRLGAAGFKLLAGR